MAQIIGGALKFVCAIQNSILRFGVVESLKARYDYKRESLGDSIDPLQFSKQVSTKCLR